MHQFKLDTIYGTNAISIADELGEIDGAKEYLDDIFADYDWINDDPMSKAYKKFYVYLAKITKEYKLLDVFKYMNSRENLNNGYGSYLVGDFKLEDYKGVDALAMYWYNRNLRIFRNIQKIETSPDDRILVLFGAGHIQILAQLFECSPEYKLVKFDDLEK